MLVIEVTEIRGKCPVYKVGDKIVIDGPRILMDKTDAISIYVLESLLHYAVALREGVDPRKLLDCRMMGNMLIFMCRSGRALY